MFDAVDEPLDNFENDYWYSIYKAIAIEKKRKASIPLIKLQWLCAAMNPILSMMMVYKSAQF